MLAENNHDKYRNYCKKIKCNKIPDIERKEAKKNRKMSANIAKIAKITKIFLVTFAIFETFADISKPFLTFSLSKCRILWNLLFLLFLPYLLLNLFTQEEKFLLLLRFLRNLRTSGSPSWPFLFLSEEFC